MRNLFWFTLGFLIGGLTGGLLALLFTSTTGEQTRALIREKALELRQRALESDWHKKPPRDWAEEKACEAESLPGDIGKGDSA